MLYFSILKSIAYTLSIYEKIILNVLSKTAQFGSSLKVRYIIKTELKI